MGKMHKTKIKTWILSHKSISLFFLFLFMLSLLSPGFALKSASPTEESDTEALSEWSKEWLEVVVPYIITKKEKKYYEKLKTEDQRGEFIERFWKIRDPNPDTPENEFKIEHYRRIAFSNKYFTTAGIAGWRTERGRMYIILGPPNSIFSNQTPYEGQKGDMTGRERLQGRDEKASLDWHAGTQTWIYYNPANRRLPPLAEFVFVDKTGNGDFTLEQRVKLRGKDIENMNIDNMTDIYDRIEAMAYANQNPFELMDKIKGTVKVDISYEYIPLEFRMYHLKSSEGKMYCPLFINVPYQEVSSTESEDEYFYHMTLLLTVKKAANQVVLEHSRNTDIKLNKDEFESFKDGAFQIPSALSLHPGDYTLEVSLIDNNSHRVGIIRDEISIPPVHPEEIDMTDIILSLETGKGKLFENLADQKELTVKNDFHRGDEVNVYFEVYNLPVNAETGECEYQVEYIFLQQGTTLANVPSSILKAKDGRDQQVSVSIKLKKFQPGTYTLQAKVKDLVSGKHTIKKTEFSVHN